MRYDELYRIFIRFGYSACVTENTQECIRAAFRYVNASLTLEEFEADKAQLARQEEIIQGRLTTELAMAQCLLIGRAILPPPSIFLPLARQP